MKKSLKWTCGILLGLCLLAAVIVACVWGSEISTIRSIKQVGDNPYLYYMEYKTPYNLDELIEKDAASNSALVDYVVSKIGKGLPIKIKSSQVKDENGELGTFNCTSFQAKKADGDGYYYGRNYDYFKNPTLVTLSHPKDGYTSLAVTDMSHVGYGLDKLPTSFMKKIMCLAAIYAPVDGINEKGLCTSIMALPKMASQQDTEKHDVGTSVIMRLFLDRCATVQEAIDLVNTVDIRHDTVVGSGYHYMVADAFGDCAVIEFDKENGWKTMIVRKSPDSTYMHVTNHLLSDKYFTTEPDPSVGNPKSKSWWRYEVVRDYLSGKEGVVTLEEAQECLSLVHWVDLQWEGSTTVEDTQWSNVYDQTTGTLNLRNWNEYDKTYTFQIETTMDKNTNEKYETDVFTTKSGKELKFHALMHASLRIEFDGKEIEIDPVGKMDDRVIDYAAFPKADFIFVTHDHYDHLDTAAIATLSKEGTQVIANRNTADALGYGTVMSNGDSLSLANWLSVEAVPAYNITEGHMQFHPKGRDNGFVLTIDGMRIYIAGDTEDIDEMAAIKDIDIAFLPCNQPYTMTVDQLLRVAHTIQPKVLFPYHYGQTDVSVIPSLLEGDGIDVRIRHYE